jgi:hypothetical protein
MPEAEQGARGNRAQQNAIAQSIRRLTPGKGGHGATASDAVTEEIAATRGRGSPLPASSRNLMESRFGTDFSHVRVHTGDYAERLSRNLGAKAFTVGQDIYFNNRSFSAESSAATHLLAHELTHTVQQGAASNLHAAQLMIQKADGDKANTAFGEFEAEKYHSLKQTADGKEVGVEIFLKFNPGKNVDAKQIALTQSVIGQRAGKSYTTLDPNYGRRAATTGAGKEHFIDVLTGYPSPLYASDTTPTGAADPTKLTSYPTVPSTALTAAQITANELATGIAGETRTGFGKHGFRYMDAGTLKGPESAELYDSPHQGSGNDTDATFESAALAIEGTQKDTYYGSVTWGFKLDATGKFSMVPFKAVSQATPSVNFLTAASVWNGASEEFNWGVSVASAKILDPADLTKTKATVTKGTALTWGGMTSASGGVTYNVVSVKDGPKAGTAGVINSAEMAMMDVGRPTVDLPIPQVHTTNTAGVWLVGDPAKATTTILSKLSKNTRVTITDDTTNKEWAKIKIVDGPETNKEGWVMKSLLTQEALGTR